MYIPMGFSAAGAHIGIKKQKKDLAIIHSNTPCVSAGIYTKNTVKAAPVTYCMGVSSGRAIIINSGNANACTGLQGDNDTARMAELTANTLGISANEVYVCSTGVISVPMPMDVIEKGIPETAKTLGSESSDFYNAAESIMTTDTFMKCASERIEIDGKTVTLFGMAKGSGMIHPNMATMLAFFITDCHITKDALHKALRAAADDTFNMISVDGDTSTNDTALILSNGNAGNKQVTEDSADYAKFYNALYNIMKKLAVDIAKDGEGATKLMEVSVKNAKTRDDARRTAKSVVSSCLVKAALFGADANWGRVIAAMGNSGADFNPGIVDISFSNDAGHVVVLDRGVLVDFCEKTAKDVLCEKTVNINIDLGLGEYEATAWGCDLTYDYVKINGDYRT